MGKNPSFPFYASDFLVDTAEWTNEEIGAYIRLLSVQWVNGSINSDPNRLPYGVLSVWDAIKYKFKKGEDARLRNKKLEQIRDEKMSYLQEQRNYGKKGAEKRWGKNRLPISDPNSIPNGENMALQSSSSNKDLKPELNSGKLSFEEKYRRFIVLFNSISKRSFKGDTKSKEKFKARLKDGYEFTDFKKAITALYTDNYHKENNYKYATPELITRSDKLEMFINMAKPQTQRPSELTVEEKDKLFTDD